uniref:Uncharacterized protein n=1 Tax=Arundo donax TaxID=35708 RepID=A0A0A9ESN7_ARUDO
MFFLRVYLVTHQDDTIKDYKGPEDLKDKRSVRRLVMKERPDYLVKLIKEIRQAKWIKESPLMRRHNEYMKEFYPEKPAKGHCKVIVVGYGD